MCDDVCCGDCKCDSCKFRSIMFTNDYSACNRCDMCICTEGIITEKCNEYKESDK